MRTAATAAGSHLHSPLISRTRRHRHGLLSSISSTVFFLSSNHGVQPRRRLRPAAGRAIVAACCLPLTPATTAAASKACVFPNNMAASLLSIGQLCDDGCIAMFDKHRVAIIKDNAVILTGRRDPKTKLWMTVDLSAATPRER